MPVDPSHSDTLAVIGSALTTIAVVAQGFYARHRGQKRDPILKEIREELKGNRTQLETLTIEVQHLDARVERVERASGTNPPFDDHPKGLK